MLYVSPLKALAVDVERNLRAPLAGIAQHRRARAATRIVAPAIAIRTGDTPAAERARFQREPADILITTPESLYLLLTSNAREALRAVETVIIDEIHALVPTKRGAHLALSLERLAALLRSRRRSASACRRRSGRSTRSRGFSAASRPSPTRRRRRQRPRRRAAAGRAPRSRSQATLDDEIDDEFAATRGAVRYRPVTIVDAGAKKALELTHRGAGRGHGAADDRPTTSRAARPRSATRGRRSGRRSIRGCSS